MPITRRTPIILLAVAAAAAVLVALAAAPAAAHASLVASDPQPGARYDRPPSAVTLAFDEPVESTLGSVRVYDARENRVDVGASRHPGGDLRRVQSMLPGLDDGVYVVTWRVTSADGHPVQGAFTFQVGDAGSLRAAQSLAARLLADQGAGTVVGVVYGLDRLLLFAALALLVGGIVFLAVVFPRARDDARARRVLWAGWTGLVVATIASVPLQGVYAAGLPLGKVFDPSVVGDVLDTRYGRVAVVRLALLAAAYPLLRMLTRHPAGGHPLPRWWYAASVLVVVGLAATPGVAGHAASGEHVVLAIPADTLHVLAMGAWLGGLVLLVTAVLPIRDPADLRQGITRFSALALGAIALLVATGAFQAWRQVGSFAALRDTDYGRLLVAKLIVFGALVVAAAFSREVVNRWFRAPGATVEPAARGALLGAPVPVAVGGPSPSGPAAEAEAAGAEGAETTADAGAGSSHGAGPSVEDTDDATEARRLRRSAVAEVVLAAIVLLVTALLVNAPPARSAETGPVSMTLRSEQVWVDVVVAPGVVGSNDIHVTAVPVGSTVAPVEQMTVQLTRAGGDLAPFDVPLRQLGPGHYVSPAFRVPYGGEWLMTVRVRLGATEESVLTGTFTVR